MRLTLVVVWMVSSVFAQVPATDGKAVHNVNLTEPRDVGDATRVNDAISVLVTDTSHCPTGTSRERQACACSFTQDLKKLKSAYAAAVAKHPGWNEDHAVVAYRNTANGNSISINFPVVKQQLEHCKI